MHAHVSPGATLRGPDGPLADPEDSLQDAFECISSYIPERSGFKDTVQALIAAASRQDRSACDRSPQDELFSLVSALDGQVSSRAREAFLLQGLGLSYEEIARQLSMSVKTVQEHIAKSLAVLSLSDAHCHD